MKGKLGSLLIPVVFATACQSTVVEEQPAATASLPPFAEPTPRVGDVWRYLNESGQQVDDETIAVDARVVTTRDSKGCTYTNQAYFAPSDWWTDCPGFDNGSQEAKREGNIFPLALGSRESWVFSGSNATDSWNSTRTCVVDSITRVAVPAGSFDAYKVVCIDQWRERTWYISPEAGTTVLFTNRQKRGGVTTRSELVAWMPATS